MDEFVYRRVHRATPRVLFECLTEPEHLTCFWGPAGTRTPLDRIVVDLRPGGVTGTMPVCRIPRRPSGCPRRLPCGAVSWRRSCGEEWAHGRGV